MMRLIGRGKTKGSSMSRSRHDKLKSAYKSTDKISFIRHNHAAKPYKNYIENKDINIMKINV